MEDALTRSGLVRQDIDYVCAHATSTRQGDLVEAQNLQRVFGDHKPWVSSLKSMTGHELWMSGASQVVYCTLMARAGFIAQNLNYTEPDPGFPELNIVTEPILSPPRRVLANSAGFGGTNSCLALRFDT